MNLKRFLPFLFPLLSGCSSLYSFEFGKKKDMLEDKITVMSYNLGNARGDSADFFKMRSKEAIISNLNCIGEQIKTMDIVGLNEVDMNSYRTYGIDQALYLADYARFPHVVEDRFFNVPSLLSLGNVILSKHPLKIMHRIKYGKGAGRIGHSFKTAVFADVSVGKENLLLGVTHLSDSHNDNVRKKEFDSLLPYLKGKPRVVLVGDLNGDPEYESVRDFISEGEFNVSENFGLPSYPAHAPLYSLDHILVSKDLRVGKLRHIDAKIVGCEEYPSDHTNVAADVYLKTVRLIKKL